MKTTSFVEWYIIDVLSGRSTGQYTPNNYGMSKNQILKTMLMFKANLFFTIGNHTFIYMCHYILILILKQMLLSYDATKVTPLLLTIACVHTVSSRRQSVNSVHARELLSANGKTY